MTGGCLYIRSISQVRLGFWTTETSATTNFAPGIFGKYFLYVHVIDHICGNIQEGFCVMGMDNSLVLLCQSDF
jgi:hypothetical protein